MSDDIKPDSILELASAYWGSRTLLAAVELGVFTELAKGPRGGAALAEALGIHPRAWRDFFDALVALGLLERDNGTYANTCATDLYLDKAKPTYLGGMMEMGSRRLFGFWAHLTEALRTGRPQNEAKSGGTLFEALERDPEQLRGFMEAMAAGSRRAAHAIAEKFPWKDYATVIDVGCALGATPVAVAEAHPHLTGGGFDLPAVRPLFEEYVARHGLSDRLLFHPGNFFTDPLPGADVLIMGRVLHDWNLEEKRMLLEKADAALPKGGALIVYESLIDDARRENAGGLLMSLNMLIETPGGFDFTGADCQGWMKDAGFASTRVEPLAGPVSMVVGVK